MLALEITPAVLKQIHAHGEAAYPEEGAGLLLGRVEGKRRQVQAILAFVNSREAEARHNRYLITSVEAGRALASRSWRLVDDRSSFTEEEIKIYP